MAYQNYNLHVFPLVLVLVGIGYLLVKDSLRENWYLTYVTVALILLEIPGISNLLLAVKAEWGSTWLIYGILGGAVWASYVVVRYWSTARDRKQLVIRILLMVVMLQLAIGVDWTGERIGMCFNPYRAEQSAVEVGKLLAEADYVRTLAPEELADALVEIAPQVSVLYGEGLSYSPQNPGYLMVEADAYGCNTFVVQRVYGTEAALAIWEEQGFTLWNETADYLIFMR